jgi:hypothetical protein
LSNQVSIQKPSKVTRAEARLEEAVVRLESAMNAKQVDELKPRENAEIKELKIEIKQLRQENAALKRVNEQVSTRLGGAIERMQIAIGE